VNGVVQIREHFRPVNITKSKAVFYRIRYILNKLPYYVIVSSCGLHKIWDRTYGKTVYNTDSCILSFGRGDVSEARESPKRKKQHSQHGECLKARIQASVCVKNIIRNLFFHIGLNLKKKSRYCCECTLYSKEIVLHYWPIVKKVTSFIGNIRTVLKVDFQENASKGSRDIALLLLCFPKPRYCGVVIMFSM